MRAPRRPRSWRRDADEAIRIARTADAADALTWSRWATRNRVKRIVLDFFAGTLPPTLRVVVQRWKVPPARGGGYRFNVVFARNRRRANRG